MTAGNSFPASRQATAVAYEPFYETATAPSAVEQTPAFQSIRGDRPAGRAASPVHQEAMQSVMFAIREAGKIVSIDGSVAAPEKPAASRSTRRKAAVATTTEFHQGVLDIFDHSNNDFRQVPSERRRQIYCEDRVAAMKHRAAAAAVDITFMLLSIALFAFPFVYGGGEIALDGPVNQMVFGSLLVLIPLLYKAFWAFAGADSPGAVILKLRLTDFDGRRPGRAVRVHRFVWSGVSTGAAFLGVAWILFDEESLSWHDHITRTFLTTVKPNQQNADQASNHRLVDAWVN